MSDFDIFQKSFFTVQEFVFFVYCHEFWTCARRVVSTAHAAFKQQACRELARGLRDKTSPVVLGCGSRIKRMWAASPFCWRVGKRWKCPVLPFIGTSDGQWANRISLKTRGLGLGPPLLLLLPHLPGEGC